MANFRWNSMSFNNQADDSCVGISEKSCYRVNDKNVHPPCQAPCPQALPNPRPILRSGKLNASVA